MALFKQGKSSKIFWGIGLFFVALFILAEGWIYYDKWQGEERVRKLAQALDEIQKEIFDRKAADKIGGKTPQETLDLYISAVERGDYELASKYFVIEKRDEELKILRDSSLKNITNIVDLLKKTTLVDAKKELEESYDIYGPGYGINQTKEEFVESMLKMYANKATMRTKWNNYNFDVNFILYPSGNWKIEEI